MNDNTDITNELKEIHEKLTDLLLELTAFCDRNNIKYSLAFGSLIGAIRHKGFVPWDDDIDIAMDRANYDKFVALVKKSKKYDFHRVHWLRSFRRVNESISIDVFPFDSVPDNKIIAKIKLLLIKILQGMTDKKENLSKLSPFYRLAVRVTALIGKPFKLSTKQKLYDRVSLIGNGKRTKQISCYHGPFAYLDKYYKHNLFDNLIQVDFENHKFNAVKDYDLFLRKYYGDYMIPPAKSKRKNFHKQNHCQ